MPLDFRYHLASLAAVFGALILGILLGVAMKEGPVLSNQVRDLRAEFDRVEAMKMIDERSDQLHSRIQHKILANRMLGRQVALVANPVAQSLGLTEAVRRALEDAGAKVTVEIEIKPSFAQLTDAQQTAILDSTRTLITPNNQTAQQPGVEKLAALLAADLGHAQMRILPALQQEKVISVNGDPEMPVSSVIYLGGASEKINAVQAVDVPFIKGCADHGLQVVATEPLDTPISVMRDYQKVAPITVDNADRVAGRLALVLALANHQRGHFGYKDSADEVIPEIE